MQCFKDEGKIPQRRIRFKNVASVTKTLCESWSNAQNFLGPLH